MSTSEIKILKLISRFSTDDRDGSLFLARAQLSLYLYQSFLTIILQ